MTVEGVHDSLANAAIKLAGQVAELERVKVKAATFARVARLRLDEIGDAQGCEAVASRRFYEGRLSALDDLGLASTT